MIKYPTLLELKLVTLLLIVGRSCFHGTKKLCNDSIHPRAASWIHSFNETEMSTMTRKQ